LGLKNLILTSLRQLFGLLFPSLCKACGTEFPLDHSPMCITCMATLPLFPYNYLLKQRFLLEIVPEVKALYFFQKQGLVQNLIHQIKYRNAPELANFLGENMGNAFFEPSSTKLLVPVPLHKARYTQRGYNQAHELCNGIAKVTQWPVAPTLLHRSEISNTQTKQNRFTRFENMEQQLSVPDPTLLGQYQTIVLVDDVLTSGATLQACSQALLKAGANTIEIWVLAATSQ
jgi:ComF family protein